jgi:hypothetical protein
MQVKQRLAGENKAATTAPQASKTDVHRHCATRRDDNISRQQQQQQRRIREEREHTHTHTITYRSATRKAQEKKRQKMRERRHISPRLSGGEAHSETQPPLYHTHAYSKQHMYAPHRQQFVPPAASHNNERPTDPLITGITTAAERKRPPATHIVFPARLSCPHVHALSLFFLYSGTEQAKTRLATATSACVCKAYRIFLSLLLLRLLLLTCQCCSCRGREEMCMRVCVCVYVLGGGEERMAVTWTFELHTPHCVRSARDEASPTTGTLTCLFLAPFLILFFLPFLTSGTGQLSRSCWCSAVPA